VALRDRVLDLLRVTPGLDDDEIGRRLGVDRHRVNGVCRELESRGLVVRENDSDRKLVTRIAESDASSQIRQLAASSTAIEAAPEQVLAVQSPSLSQSLKAAREFELHAKRVLSARWHVSLEPRVVRLTEAAEPKVKFDLVSADATIVGDAKFLKNIAVPAAKWSVIAEYVWLLQHVKNAKRRFMVFGQDRQVAQRWLVRFRPLTEGVEFYFLDGEQLINL
jgi:DNA-binding MarR family transcriptional regulator